MFDAIRNNKRIAQVILALLIIPFAFFGLGSYFADNPKGNELAKINGEPIYRADLDRLLRDVRERTPDLAETPEVRKEILDQLILERLFQLYARDERLSVSADLLRQVILQEKAFQVDGKFSEERYKQVMRSSSMTEADIARQVLLQQLSLPISSSSFIAQDSARRYLAAALEERTVREIRFPVAPYLAGIQITDADIQKFYDENQERFSIPERVKAEYLVLDAESLRDKVKVSEEDILRAYHNLPEERQVRHILIRPADGGGAAAEEAAKKEAEEIAKTLRGQPDRFPALAKEKSQDRSSGEAGGDLGRIARGTAIDPAFDAAVFALKQGEISNPVRTQYGFHIIQVTSILSKRSLDEMRDEIKADPQLLEQATQQQYSKEADDFIDMVFTKAADSLQPAAEAFNLKIQRTGWINRGADTLGGFRNKTLVENLFADDSLIDHHNTQGVEVAPLTMVSARVVEHEAKRNMPLEEVRGQIEAELRAQAAASRAREAGTVVLAALKKGEPSQQAWSEPRVLQRYKTGFLPEPLQAVFSTAQAQPELPPSAATALFSASLEKLPALATAEIPDDAFVIYQIEKAESPDFDDGDARLPKLKNVMFRLFAGDDLDAFLAYLHTRYKVQVNPDALQAEN
ncbi:MAG: SurA N-terminal domain-containing protein [Azoarcus sp.]|jgi:peptidyl-prolyl cis-trans isomerase D|nr:SurA N-terminal domain-containing protein [Azoarcus sp.]